MTLQQGESNPAAILYAAKSTEDKRGSIRTQLDDARAMAEREGYQVVADYHEAARSAYRGNRGPQLQAAKEHAVRLATESRPVAIFVQHSDRLARGDGITAMHLVEHVLWAMKANVELRSVQDDDACRNLLYAAVNGARNHEDSKRKAAATAAGIRREVIRGRWHGPAPFGYRALGRREERHLVVDEEAAVVVRRIFNEYLTAGSGTALIAHHLNEDGVPAPRASRWDRSTVALMLDQPAYIGLVRINGETFPGNQPAIIEEAVWSRARTQREARKPGVSHIGRPPNGTHLLTNGLLRCGECGAAMRPRSPHERKDRYECATRDRAGGHTRCSMRGVLREKLDGPLLRYLEGVVFDLDETRRVIAEEHARRSSENEVLIAQAERAVTERDDALVRIRADYVRGAITAEKWNEFEAELTQEREAAVREREQLATRAGQLTTEVEVFNADEEIAVRLAALREAVAGEVTGANGLAEVRAALGRCFESITLHQADEDGLMLVPTVLTDPDDLATGWLDLRNGQALSLPRQRRMPVPQGVTDGS
jgi:DNA invertase Pin-like site-specific DNA recombinase